MSKKADGEQRVGLYRREEHDACGVGFVAQLGRPASHQVVEQALQALGCLAHRGGVDADGTSGDGAGILILLPTSFFIPESRRARPTTLCTRGTAHPRHSGSLIQIFTKPRSCPPRLSTINPTAPGLRRAGSWRSGYIWWRRTAKAILGSAPESGWPRVRR